MLKKVKIIFPIVNILFKLFDKTLNTCTLQDVLNIIISFFNGKKIQINFLKVSLFHYFACFLKKIFIK